LFFNVGGFIMCGTVNLKPDGDVDEHVKYNPPDWFVIAGAEYMLSGACNGKCNHCIIGRDLEGWCMGAHLTPEEMKFKAQSFLKGICHIVKDKGRGQVVADVRQLMESLTADERQVLWGDIMDGYCEHCFEKRQGHKYYCRGDN